MAQLTEFEIIKQYFTNIQHPRHDVLLSVGDDAAILQLPSEKQLVVTVDMQIAGVHFVEDWPASDIGYRSLAVSLSDLAAMGATPMWVMLALSLPQADQQWLSGFSEGFFSLADRFKLSLIGGDTCQGPLTITVQAHIGNVGLIYRFNGVANNTADDPYYY